MRWSFLRFEIDEFESIFTFPEQIFYECMYLLLISEILALYGFLPYVAVMNSPSLYSSTGLRGSFTVSKLIRLTKWSSQWTIANLAMSPAFDENARTTFSANKLSQSRCEIHLAVTNTSNLRRTYVLTQWKFIFKKKNLNHPDLWKDDSEWKVEMVPERKERFWMPHM